MSKPSGMGTDFDSDVEADLASTADADGHDGHNVAITAESAEGEADEATRAIFPQLRLPWSGLYSRPRPGQPPFAGDELRLDVDGPLPLKVVSGVRRSLFTQLHWVARIKSVAPNVWQGSIFYKDGTASLLPQSSVRVRLYRTGFLGQRKAEVTFSGGGTASFSHIYEFRSPYFEQVEFEFDATGDAHPVYSIRTDAHPNRPADLPAEELSIATVYRRAGFDVQTSSGASTVATGAGADAVWSDTELHDALQANWSRYANRPQWRMWVFSAALHEDTPEYDGDDLGGIMFDSDPGRQPHRQGTAIFTESFIKDAPPGDPAAAAYIARSRFWTAAHEMGHAFNLAHAWQKQHPPQWGTPWIPLQNEPEGRSFMNYPFRVSGGQAAFYANFRYRFSDQELLFMRHAPRRFVQMGNADWFDNHGFQNAAVSPEPSLRLTVRLNRARPVLEFLEPAMFELKLSNISSEPMLVDKHILKHAHDFTFVVKRDGRPARVWRPFANMCLRMGKTVLAPGDSIYQPLFAATGPDGWLVAEPGWYTVQACLRLETGEDCVSAPLRLKVLPPRGHEEEFLAQDLFTEPVARVLAFDGSRESSLDSAKDLLHEAVDKFHSHRVSIHAGVALALPLLRSGKVVVSEDARAQRVQPVAGKPEEGRKLLQAALLDKPDEAAQSLGHIEYRGYTETLVRTLADGNEVADARKVASNLESTLAKRGVRPDVLGEIRAMAAALPAEPGGVRTAKAGRRTEATT